jgi:hypothetical protein
VIFVGARDGWVRLGTGPDDALYLLRPARVRADAGRMEVELLEAGPLRLRGSLRLDLGRWSSAIPFDGTPARVRCTRPAGLAAATLAAEAHAGGYAHLAPFVHDSVLFAWRETLPEVGFDPPGVRAHLARGFRPAQVVALAKASGQHLDPRAVGMQASRERSAGRLPPSETMTEVVRRSSAELGVLHTELQWQFPDFRPTRATVRALRARLRQESTSKAGGGAGGGGA